MNGKFKFSKKSRWRTAAISDIINTLTGSFAPYIFVTYLCISDVDKINR